MRNVEFETAPASQGESTPDVKILVAYDDAIGLQQAGELEELIVSKFAGELKTAVSRWGFPLLRHPRLRDHAIREAGEAQLIILATDGTELPAHVQFFLENLPAREAGKDAALVVLTSRKSRAFGPPPSVMRNLRLIAESRNLDFFCNDIGWRASDFAPLQPPSSSAFNNFIWSHA